MNRVRDTLGDRARVLTVLLATLLVAATVDTVAHDHGWPVPFAAAAADLAIALVVVAVALSEPVGLLVVVALVWVLARLVRVVPDVVAASAARPTVGADPRRGRRRRVASRHALRRGPPVGSALAV